MKQRNILMSVLVLAGLCVNLFTSGCHARAKNMIPQDYELTSQKSYTLSLNESLGGINPKPTWSSQISNTEFTAALRGALEKSGVFAEVTTGDVADYILDVQILSYDQPWHGADMSVRMETMWKLTDAKSQEVVWSNTFPSAYRAAWVTSITDTGRIKKAQEGAARNTIREGIRRLSLLNL